jgi:tRNA 2-selenouridine synthase
MESRPSSPVGDFLSAQQAGIPVLDVRSPGEYAQGHIPGAINMPLFEDDERAEIGTLYKQVGQQAAIDRGWELVRPKLDGFVRSARETAVHERLLVHCWRGGMRSGHMAAFLRSNGLSAETLDGGYKSFRRIVLDTLERPLKLLVLGGETGSGKTETLRALEAMGEQVLDLEKFAHHRGSAFGGLGEPPQPTSEQFENNIFPLFAQFDPDRPVWVEDESRNIGQVFLHAPLWFSMQRAPVVRLEIPLQRRIERLVQDYGAFPKDELATGLHKIAKRLGGLALQQALSALEAGRLDEVARTSLHYYDRAYRRHLAERAPEKQCAVTSASGDPLHNARLVLAAAKRIFEEKKDDRA